MEDDHHPTRNQPTNQENRYDLVNRYYEQVNAILSGPPFVEPNELPVQLLPWLYLSDMFSAGKANKLIELGITHVLTTNKMEDWEHLYYARPFRAIGITHYIVDGHDMEGYDMIGNHWQECKEFLLSVRQQPNAKVVVHCAAGQNRSGLIAAAAMLLLDDDGANSSNNDNDASAASNDTKQKNKNDADNKQSNKLLDVVKSLKAKRGLVLTNESFQWQLCALAANENII